jgi:hypothetical protein
MRTIYGLMVTGALALGVSGCRTTQKIVPDPLVDIDSIESTYTGERSNRLYSADSEQLEREMAEAWWDGEVGQRVMADARCAVDAVLRNEQRQGTGAGETVGELMIMAMDERVRGHPELAHYESRKETESGRRYESRAQGFVNPGRDWCAGFEAFHRAANEMYTPHALRKSDAMQELFRRFIQEEGCDVNE